MDMSEVLTEVVTVSSGIEDNEDNSLEGSSIYIQNNNVLQDIQERQAFNDIKIQIGEKLYGIEGYFPSNDEGTPTNITISDVNNLTEILVNSRFNVYDLSDNSARIPVSWEKIL